MDWDSQLPEDSRSGVPQPAAEGYCGTCKRPIYQPAAFPGVPSEWRHRSSNHAISWSPEKHLASLTSVKPHAHKWVPEHGNTEHCSFDGCDSTLTTVDRSAQTVEAERLTERERRTAESRLRGSHATKTARRQALPGGPRF